MVRDPSSTTPLHIDGHLASFSHAGVHVTCRGERLEMGHIQGVIVDPVGPIVHPLGHLTDGRPAGGFVASGV